MFDFQTKCNYVLNFTKPATSGVLGVPSLVESCAALTGPLLFFSWIFLYTPLYWPVIVVKRAYVTFGVAAASAGRITLTAVPLFEVPRVQRSLLCRGAKGINCRLGAKWLFGESAVKSLLTKASFHSVKALI